MGQLLKNTFSVVTKAAVLATSIVGAGVSSAADQLTISPDDLFANDGVLKFAMESGATLFNAKCTLDEGNEKAVNLDGEKYQSSKAMKVQYSFNTSGQLVGLDILDGAKPRFASPGWDAKMYEATDTSINGFNAVRGQADFNVEYYTLNTPNLTPIEHALQESGAGFYSGSIRPLDDLYSIEKTPNSISQSNMAIIDGGETAFDVDKQDGSLAVSITRAYNDEGQYGKVETTISFHGIVASGGLASTSFTFDKDMGALPNGHVNYKVDERKKDLLLEESPEGFIVAHSLSR